MSVITQAAKQEKVSNRLVEKTEATSKLITPNKNAILFIGNEEIRNSVEETCLNQAVNLADAPGVDKFVLSADCHVGHGTCVGSIASSKEMIYPCFVGPDIACGMSFLQLNVPKDAVKDKNIRRAIINAIEDRIPMGTGSRQAKKRRDFDIKAIYAAIFNGATRKVLNNLGIDESWVDNCESPIHGDPDVLMHQYASIERKYSVVKDKLIQIGSIGGGNHMNEIEVVNVEKGMESIANSFGLKDQCVNSLCHFGSRGFGFFLSSGGKGGYPGQFRKLASHFNKWHINFPGNDVNNVYIPVGTPECDEYLNDMYMGANFATVNHLLVQSYVLEAFKEVLGNQVEGKLVYHIAHNIIRNEIAEDEGGRQHPTWVHRKGATRALPAGHHILKDTKFYKTGHPVLLPGNAIEGSKIMVGLPGTRRTLNSINHGAGRAMSRTRAKETFRQKDVDAHFEAMDILTNCRQYPIDECAGSYKNYSAVIDSVVKAGLASTVATLKPVIVIKDGDQDKEGSY